MRVAALLICLAACDAEAGVPGGSPPAPAGEPDADIGCPAGETCSGIETWRFSLAGTAPSDYVGVTWPPWATALGGVQTYHVFLDGRPLQDFVADAPATATVLDQHPPDVVLESDGTAGKGDLRVLDPDSGRLFSRFEIGATRVDSIVLFGRAAYGFMTQPWVLMTGARGQIMVRLLDANRWALADQRIVIEGPGVEQLAWDRVAVTPAAAGDLTLGVHLSDGRTLDAAVHVVDACDDIRSPAGDTVELYSYWTYQFDYAGAAGGAPILGAPITLDVPVELNPQPGAPPGSVLLYPQTAGTFTIAAHCGDFSKDFTYTVY